MAGESVRLCEVSAHNYTELVTVVHLRIIEGGNTLHEEQQELGPPEDGYENEFYVQGSELHSREGEFSIQIKQDDGEWKERYLADRADSITVRIFVRDQERLPDLETAYITNPDC